MAICLLVLGLSPTGVLAATCAANIATFQKLIDGDRKTGFIGKEVYARASGDLKAAGKLCKEGQDGAASAAVSAARSRYGYPAGSNQNLPQ